MGVPGHHLGEKKDIEGGRGDKGMGMNIRIGKKMNGIGEGDNRGTSGRHGMEGMGDEG